jgi:hypothetical protein
MPGTPENTALMQAIPMLAPIQNQICLLLLNVSRFIKARKGADEKPKTTKEDQTT